MNTVNIANLKAKLSHFLRRVRNGDTIIVLDRHVPVARIVPHEPDTDDDAVPSRKPAALLSDFRIPPKPLCSSGSLEVLLEQRQQNR